MGDVPKVCRNPTGFGRKPPLCLTPDSSSTALATFSTNEVKRPQKSLIDIRDPVSAVTLIKTLTSEQGEAEVSHHRSKRTNL